MDDIELFAAIDAERDRLIDLAAQLWETPELGLHEHESPLPKGHEPPTDVTERDTTN